MHPLVQHKERIRAHKCTQLLDEMTEGKISDVQSEVIRTVSKLRIRHGGLQTSNLQHVHRHNKCDKVHVFEKMYTT